MEHDFSEEAVALLARAAGVPIEEDRLAEVTAVFNQLFALGREVMAVDVEAYEPEMRFDAGWREATS
ncbi:MAG TPA: hypothetical protein VFL82_02365 [Thermomicrobiales bacterium]|nr:hypothetical protein [Thermomicrobiales bacterium]